MCLVVLLDGCPVQSLAAGAPPKKQSGARRPRLKGYPEVGKGRRSLHV